MDYAIAIENSLSSPRLQHPAPPSPAPSIVEGSKAWKKDMRGCKLRYKDKGASLEGYVGLAARIYGE
jgi:hypothetical protein